jgi:hypothetical protein
VNTNLAHGDQTITTLTPRMRTHLGKAWYFLWGLSVPVPGQRNFDLGYIFWFMAAW